MTDKNPLFVSKSMPFYYVMVVWGDKYIDMLLDVALPCLLAPDNLPTLSNLSESRFLIMTRSCDRARIADSQVLKLLNKTITVEFVDSPWIEEDIPYHLKAARGHQEAARMAAKDGAYCVFLAPDFLLSNGSLRFLVDIAHSGKQAVMTPGIRVVTETILEEIKSSYPIDPKNVLNIGSRALVKLCMRHVHVEDQRYNWGHPYFSRAPVVCTWDIPGEHGLLVRAFHLHPLLVKMNSADSAKLLDTNTIDGEFLGLNFPEWEVIHVESDSDNVALFSLTDREDRNQPLELNEASIEKLRSVAYSVLANPLHRYYFTKAIKLHSGELNEKWAQVERDTGLLAYKVLSNSVIGASDVNPLAYASGRAMLRELMFRVKRRLFAKLRRLKIIRVTTATYIADLERKNRRLQDEISYLTNRVTELDDSFKKMVGEKRRKYENQRQTNVEQNPRTAIPADTGKV